MSPVLVGAVSGLVGGLQADLHAWSRAKRLVTWKAVRIAVFRWLCGAVLGAMAGAGLGGSV